MAGEGTKNQNNIYDNFFFTQKTLFQKGIVHLRLRKINLPKIQKCIANRAGRIFMAVMKPISAISYK